MKRISHFCIVATLAMPFLLTACMDNDVYDPSTVKPVQPTENPFGEDITVPEGFPWSMINTVKLTAEVNDEFNGQYQYLIEVFTDNPLTKQSATPLAAGYANKNAGYTTEVSIPQTVSRLFLRQTDPKQRKEVYEYAVPEKGGTLNCKLYYTPPTTKATTRASQDGGNSGWNGITDPGYTEDTYNIPSESATINYGQLAPGAVYVIKPGATLSGTVNSYNGANATIYVQGTWNVNGQVTPQGIDIIVLNGGKIYSRSGTFLVSDKSSLTIQTGGVVECDNFNTATKVVIKNFGKIHAQRIAGGGFNTGTILYNAPGAVFNVNGKFEIMDTEIYNHGSIDFSSTTGYLITNNNKRCIIANYAKAIIKGNQIEGGAMIVNSGVIEVNNLTNSSEDALYNNCTIIVKNTFKFRNVILDKGSITGGRLNETETEWLPVPNIESLTDSKFTLKDGSLIKARKFDVQSGNVVFKAINSSSNTDKSMIKVLEYLHFHEPTHVELLGNLVIEGQKTGLDDPYRQLKMDESVNTGYDESKYTIETCGGIFNEGNEGLPPSNPIIPAEIEDGATYTYAFEDQWPVYGDFDMNDLVITIDKKGLTSQNKKLTVQGRIRAVGAGKDIGAGIRFLNVNAGSVTSVEGKTQSTNGNKATLAFEAGQKYPVIILCDDAHRFCGNSEGDKTFFCTDPTVSSEYNTSDGANFEITMEFNSEAEAQKAFAINNIDVFIINKAASKGTNRTEVHVAGYAPTDVADTSQFGAGNDASKPNSAFGCPAKGNYISCDGLAWGICIPLSKNHKDENVWAWPIERTIITKAYPGFKAWITSNGTDSKDWASQSSSNNIFVKPSK